MPEPKPYRPVALRFWNKVAMRGEDECWLWTGAQMGGYGYLVMGKGLKKKLAHRAAWEIEYGFTMPRQLHACHHCDIRLCCNPKHIYAGTQSQNVKDAWDRIRQHTRKAACVHGHPYSGANVHIRPNGERMCRACNRMHAAATTRRRKEREAA
jgi:hypothetical protein